MLANRIATAFDLIAVLPELDFPGYLFALGDAEVRKSTAGELLRIFQTDPKSPDLHIPDEQINSLFEKVSGEGIEEILFQLGEVYASTLKRPKPQGVLYQRGTLLSDAMTIADVVRSPLFLHIFRDPRASISSVQRVGAGVFNDYDKTRMGRMDTYGLARNWAAYMKRVARIAKKFPGRVKEIQYETFCADESAALDDLCEFLGITRAPGAERRSGVVVGFDEQEIHRLITADADVSRISAWQNELSPRKGYVVERVAGQEFLARGYRCHFSDSLSGSDKFVAVYAAVLEFFYESSRNTSVRLMRVFARPQLLRVGLLRVCRKIIGPGRFR